MLAGTTTEFDPAANMTADASITATFKDKPVVPAGKTYTNDSTSPFAQVKEMIFDATAGTITYNGTTYTASEKNTSDYGDTWVFSGSSNNPWGINTCLITLLGENALYVWNHTDMDEDTDVEASYTLKS